MFYKTNFCDDAEQKYPDQKQQTCVKSLQCGYWHADRQDRRTPILNEIQPKKLHQIERVNYDVRNPQNSMVTSNPNHLMQFLKQFHHALSLEQPLIQMDMNTINQLFWENSINTSLLQIIKTSGIIPLTLRPTSSELITAAISESALQDQKKTEDIKSIFFTTNQSQISESVLSHDSDDFADFDQNIDDILSERFNTTSF